MSPKLLSNQILFKRSESSDQEQGVILELCDRYGHHKSKLIYDDDMKIVDTYYKYCGIPHGRYYRFITCTKFVMWDKEPSDREPEDMVIFHEKKKYIILDNDKDGVTLLDEHFKKVKLLYASYLYGSFQQY